MTFSQSSGLHFFNRSGWAGYAGIIDQHIEATQRIDSERNHRLDVCTFGDVADFGDQSFYLLRERIERFSVDVADKNLCAVARERPRNFPSDAGCSGCYQK